MKFYRNHLIKSYIHKSSIRHISLYSLIWGKDSILTYNKSHNFIKHWESHERLDYSIIYKIPSDWEISEKVTNNSLQIRCIPLNTKETSSVGLHNHTALTISAFIYNQQCPAHCMQLLDEFINLLSHTTYNPIEVKAMLPFSSHQHNFSYSLSLISNKIENISRLNTCDTSKCPDSLHQLYSLQYQLNRKPAICQRVLSYFNYQYYLYPCSSILSVIDFQPMFSPPLRGTIRIFIHPSTKVHYICLFAVNKDLYHDSIPIANKLLKNISIMHSNAWHSNFW